MSFSSRCYPQLFRNFLSICSPSLSSHILLKYTGSPFMGFPQLGVTCLAFLGVLSCLAEVMGMHLSVPGAKYQPSIPMGSSMCLTPVLAPPRHPSLTTMDPDNAFRSIFFSKWAQATCVGPILFYIFLTKLIYFGSYSLYTPGCIKISYGLQYLHRINVCVKDIYPSLMHV